MTIFPLLKPSQQKRKDWRVVDGIKTFSDKVTGAIREKCMTSAARERRRREIYDRAEGLCEKCGRRLSFEQKDPLAFNAMHWHHKIEKGMGGGFTDDSLANAKCLCKDCHLQGEHHQF